MTKQTTYSQIVSTLTATINKLPDDRRRELIDKVGPLRGSDTPFEPMEVPRMETDVTSEKFEAMAQQFRDVAEKREAELLESRERSNRELRELREKANVEVEKFRATAREAEELEAAKRQKWNAQLADMIGKTVADLFYEHSAE